MIVYKYVIKRLNQYYPLINFGLDHGKIRNCSRYKLNKIYDNPIDFKTLSKPIYQRRILDNYYGYHFFKQPMPKYYDSNSISRMNGNIYIDWTRFFKRQLKKNLKITILICEIKKSYIIKENENRIVAKKFKVLGEYNA